MFVKNLCENDFFFSSTPKEMIIFKSAVCVWS